MVVYDLCNIFFVKLKEFPITMFLTVSPRINSEPFSPITVL